jgi:Phage tail lysozyme
VAVESIREFVASFGYKIDESSERKFTGSLEAAVVKANLLSAAIEAMATTVAAKVGEVGTQFEQLFYQSSRVGASASSIRAFEYAVSQLGGTIEGANSSLEDFAKFLRETPGATATVARLLKIPLEDAKDSAKFLLEANESLSRLSPALQAKYRETFHLGDYNTSHALQNPAALGLYGGQLERDAASGITGDAMKRATEFEQAWRGVWARIGSMAEGGESKLLTALTNPMQKFSDWLDKNSPQLNDAIGKMATAVGSLTTAWVDDLDRVHWEDVAKDFDDTAKSIAGFVVELRDLIRWMVEFDQKSKDWWFVKAMNWTAGGPGATGGMTPGGIYDPYSDPSNPSYSAGGENAPGIWNGVKSWWGSHAPGWLGGGGGGAPPGIRARGAGGAPTGNEADLAKQAYSYWRSQGLSHDAALAVIGNERGENALGSLNRGDGGSAAGQFQWHGDRRADILANTGIDVATAGFLDQQKAARWEMEHGRGGGGIWNSLKNAKSREDAVWLMVHGFERSADQRGDYATRLGYADRYGRLIPAVGGATLPTSSPSAPTPSAPGASLGGPTGIPKNWDTGPGWDGLNSNLPVGPGTSQDISKTVQSTVNNNITVNGPDPQSTAAMVGVHLNRSANDISRNLQGAFQ